MEPDRETLQIEVVAENADRSGVYFTVLDLPAMGGRIQDALQRLRSTATPERPFDVSIPGKPEAPGAGRYYSDRSHAPRAKLFCPPLGIYAG